MKVLLRQDVDNLGYAGEVMDVADGYGRNYLIPRGFAVKATPGVLKEARSWRERAAARLDELRKEHQSLTDRIAETVLEFTARAGETGKLYGSVTTHDIVEQLNETLGTNVDRRNVVGGPLRQLGSHRVTIRLSRDYQPQVTVLIHSLVDETEPLEATAEESAEAEPVEEAEAEVEELTSEEAEETSSIEEGVSDEEAVASEEVHEEAEA